MSRESPNLTGWGNRGPLDIMAMILKACRASQLKTRIIYGCNLNTKQLHQYLDLLESQGLIEKLEGGATGRTTCKITETGEKYLEAYRRLEEAFM
ncbi:MAG: hypothetical protein KGI33_08910 [Thaumarchaeota archaeon]|nr:hypothetical protein [Nitrososphaerota archaeon]